MMDKHLEIAIGEIGQAEVAGTAYNKRIAEYLATVGMAADDEIPWCAAFVNWCLKNAGLSGTNLPNAKSYLDWGFRIAFPQTGAIVVLNRGKYEWQGHVGFFLDQSKSYVYLLGGNQENRVSIRPYSKESLVGYRWTVEFE